MMKALYLLLFVFPATRSFSVKIGSNYEPYTENSYDLGPTTRCESLSLSMCKWSEPVRIPSCLRINASRLMERLSFAKSMTSFGYERCFDSFSEGICGIIASFSCDANALTLSYGDDLSHTVMQSCSAFFQCLPSSTLALLAANLCSLTNYPSKISAEAFSLTQGRSVHMPLCSNATRELVTPEWIANYVDGRYREFAFFVRQMFVYANQACVDALFRMICTFPSYVKAGDDRLRGYVTKDICADVFDLCLVALKPYSESSLDGKVFRFVLDMLCDIHSIAV